MESIKTFLEQWDLLGFVIAAVISLLMGLAAPSLSSPLGLPKEFAPIEQKLQE